MPLKAELKTWDGLFRPVLEITDGHDFSMTIDADGTIEATFAESGSSWMSLPSRSTMVDIPVEVAETMAAFLTRYCSKWLVCDVCDQRYSRLNSEAGRQEEKEPRRYCCVECEEKEKSKA